MSAKNELASKEAFASETTSSAGAGAVVTLTAPTNSKVATLYITGISLSFSAAPGAVAVTLSGVMQSDNTAGTRTWQISANATAPIEIQFGVHPLRIVPATNAVLTVPSVGGSTVVTAALYAFKGAI